MSKSTPLARKTEPVVPSLIASSRDKTPVSLVLEIRIGFSN